MKSVKNIIVAALAISSFFFHQSCKKDNSSPVSTSTIVVVPSKEQIDETNQSMEHFAKKLAKGLENKDIRRILKEEILKKIDGDFDVLWKDIKQIKTNTNNSFKELLNVSNDKISPYHIENNPCFHLSIPVLANEWNSDSYIPLVALDLVGKDESEITELKAYDAEGNLHLIDANSLPAMPVIVLGINERTDVNGNLQSLYLEKNEQDTEANKTQTTYALNYFKKMKVMNISEPWFKGDAEICLSVSDDSNYNDEFNFGYDDSEDFYNSSDLNKLFYSWDIAQSQENKWLTVNMHMGNVAESNYTNYQIYFWYEDDASLFWSPGIINYNGHTYYFDLCAEDDVLGYNVVYDYQVASSTYLDPYFFTTTSTDIKYSLYAK